nr:hypothetical protein [Moritella viscosa]SHO01271.1 Putative uncharacterized protein [Moritella viscosa]
MNHELLKEHIIKLSVSDVYAHAINEWTPFRIEVNDYWDTCPCGQEIKEMCFIKNTKNGNETYVGNVCINRFMGINMQLAFDGYKRISKDKDKKPNSALIAFANDNGYIFENEYIFLQQIKNKRSVSVKQLSWLNKINHRILEQRKVIK